MISGNNHQHPVITIVTPSFNQGRFIGQAVNSVLSQGVPDVEHLIFDAGSTDETIRVLKSFGDSIQWVSEPDKGQSDAVNKGLKAATGEFIGWLNSDDIFYPGSFKAVLNVFETMPQVDILYGMADHIDEANNVIEPYYNEEWNYGRLRDVCFICQPAVFFRKSIVERFGVLDERLRYCMDYEYWLRIGRKKPFYYLKQKLAGSRLYKETKTLGSAVAVHKEILHMFKDHFPPIPDRWIFNYAHVVSRDLGLSADAPGKRLQFFSKVVLVSLWTSLRLRGYVSRPMLRTIGGWIASARSK